MEVGWRDLPRRCSSTSSVCTFRELALNSNAPPQFTTLSSSGDPIHETFRGSQVVRRARIVTVHDGVFDSAAGEVRAGSLRFVGSACQRAGSAQVLHAGLRTSDDARNATIFEHLAVFVQRFGDSYSHIFFQTLPQISLLLSQLSAEGLPAPSLLVPRSDTLEQVIAEGFSIPRSRIFRVRDSAMWRARRLSLLLLPPGACPNWVVYPRGVMRRPHRQIIAAGQAQQPRNLVVYLHRPRPMLRFALNDAQFRAALNASLLPPFQMVVLDPGGGAHAVNEADSMSWRAMRGLMLRAAAVVGAHGSAFANVFFAQDAAAVHLIELNLIGGRACHLIMHQAAGAASTFWTIQPIAMDPRRFHRGGQLVPAPRKSFYEGPMWMPTRLVLIALQVARVTDATRADAAWRASAHLSPPRPRWLPWQLT